MTLKYKLVSIENPLYRDNKKALVSSMETLAVCKDVMSSIKFDLTKTNNAVADIFSRAKVHLTNARTNANKLGNIPKQVKNIHLTSDRKWLIYNEFISDECGRTRYGQPDASEYVEEDGRIRFKGKPVEMKIDMLLPYEHNTNMLKQVEELKTQALAKLREHRRKRKEIPYVEKVYDKVRELPFTPKYKSYAGGGFGLGGSNHCIHMEKGEIMKLKEATKLRKVFTDKKPLTNAHHVGIEIEFICKLDKFEVAQALAEEHVEEYVTLKNDGSLRPEKEYKYAHELCVIAPQEIIHAILRAVTKAMDKCGSKVNRRCGLHVHLDMRNRNKERVFTNLVRSQRILYGMNPVSRLTGQYADGQTERDIYSKKVDTTDFEQVASSGDRYLGINASAYNKFKTIEVRIHSGSSNFEKISNWVRILTSIADHAEVIKTESAKPETFCERFGLDDGLLKYIKERTAKFKDSTGKHVSVDEVA